jgi:hypothetical protein
MVFMVRNLLQATPWRLERLNQIIYTPDYALKVASSRFLPHPDRAESIEAKKSKVFTQRFAQYLSATKPNWNRLLFSSGIIRKSAQGASAKFLEFTQTSNGSDRPDR